MTSYSGFSEFLDRIGRLTEVSLRRDVSAMGINEAVWCRSRSWCSSRHCSGRGEVRSPWSERQVADQRS